MSEAHPQMVLKNVATGEIVGQFAPFWPPTRVVYAVKTAAGWQEVASGARD